MFLLSSLNGTKKREIIIGFSVNDELTLRESWFIAMYVRTYLCTYVCKYLRVLSYIDTLSTIVIYSFEESETILDFPECFLGFSCDRDKLLL